MDKFTLEDMMEFGETFTMKRLADAPEAQVNLVCLPPNQALPAHNANSNVRLLVLRGELSITLEGQRSSLAFHEMAPVAFGTFMQIANETAEDAAFLVIKTPNPSEMLK